MSFYPSFQELMEKQQDGVLLEVRRSFRSILSNMFIFILSIVIVYAINFVWESPYLKDIPFKEYVSPRWFSLIPVLIFLEILRRYNDDLYIFDNSRLTHYEGRLSLNYAVPNLRYSDLRAISVSQDLWGRLFDYGDIALSTAAQVDSEIVLEGVREPQGLARIIDDLRTYHREGLVGGSDGESGTGAAEETLDSE